ncbi:hypothetical protein C8J57DRAFT_1084823 [Mycena rebaudengoi]|nr:hypothetical protein C8J57DRAFT_1084823 [Mycena rebaudengoi]
MEFRLVNTYKRSELYTRQLRYVCSRTGTGGEKGYITTHPDWNRKRGPKRTDCECTLLVKQYPEISTILGNYTSTHNHDLGNANLPFTQIPKNAREHIAALLRMKVAPDHILKMLHRGVYDQDTLFECDLNADSVAARTEFIELRDIRRIEKDIEAEAVRLHPDDGQSILKWVERLKAKGYLLGFKSKTDPAPPGSGIPTAWMLASNGTQATITYFLKIHRQRSPEIIPRRIMSDFDWGQIHSCANVYLAIILLCWWHVLHSWQQHFSIPAYLDLWELLKKWIRITDSAEFEAAWVKIQLTAPEDFVEYLRRYWMPEHVVKMWSAVFRTSRSIFEDCDTNMLIEATLLNDVLPYYALKQRRQDLGFEGPDLEVEKRKNIMKQSQVYVKSDITQVSDCGTKFLVPSKSDPSRVYEVDIDTYTCTCLDYPLICFCKHICAVQTFFDEPRDGAGASPKVPSLPSPLLPQHQPEPDLPHNFSGPKRNELTITAEKLELLAARLRRRRNNKNNAELPELADLEQALDSMLLATDVGSVLPTPQHFAPVVKETCRATMMPAVKTRRKPAGDAAYGAGASSGAKAKKDSKK